MYKRWNYEAFKAMVIEYFNIEVWEVDVPSLYQLSISADDFSAFLLDSKAKMVEEYGYKPIEEYKIRMEINDDDINLLHILHNCFEIAERV